MLTEVMSRLIDAANAEINAHRAQCQQCCIEVGLPPDRWDMFLSITQKQLLQAIRQAEEATDAD